MRSMIRTLSGIALLMAVSVAGAQQPGGGGPGPGQQKGPGGKTGFDPNFVRPPAAPKKSALEEALEQALKNNPDLRVAASKLALAEAELSRTRLQITQKVAAAYAETLSERAVVAEMERQVKVAQSLHAKGGIPREELSKAELQFTERKAKFAAAQRELDNLQGKGSRDEKQRRAAIAEFYRRTGHLEAAAFYDKLQGERVRAGTELSIATGASFLDYDGDGRLDLFIVKTDATDKLRQTLQKKATLTVREMSLAALLAQVRKTAGGINIQANTKGEAWKETINFDFEDVTIGGMLQFLEDNLTGHKIIVREYGLLIVPKAKVPPGAVTLTAFLATSDEKPKATPTGDEVGCKITRIDEKGGLCTISMGRKQGIAKGQILEVFRLAPSPKYLGKLEVVEIAGDCAECKPSGRINGNLKVGDQVATKLAGK